MSERGTGQPGRCPALQSRIPHRDWFIQLRTQQVSFISILRAARTLIVHIKTGAAVGPRAVSLRPLYYSVSLPSYTAYFIDCAPAIAQIFKKLFGFYSAIALAYLPTFTISTFSTFYVPQNIFFIGTLVGSESSDVCLQWSAK